MYAILVIIICFYGVYEQPSTSVKFSIGTFSIEPSDIESDEIGTSDIVLITPITEDDRLVSQTIPLQILPEITESNGVNNNRSCTWVGDWNKY